MVITLLAIPGYLMYGGFATPAWLAAESLSQLLPLNPHPTGGGGGGGHFYPPLLFFLISAKLIKLLTRNLHFLLGH